MDYLKLKSVLMLAVVPLFVLWTGLGFYWFIDELEYQEVYLKNVRDLYDSLD